MNEVRRTTPEPIRPFLEFASLLRTNAFPVAPDQTQSFIAAIGLLGPRGMTDIYRAATSVFAPSPERREDFDALFRMVFLGQTISAAAAEADDEDEVQAFDERDGEMEPPEPDDIIQSGSEATALEALTVRSFAAQDEAGVLRHLIRQGGEALPKRRSRRFARSRRLERPDMRRALRAAARNDGEVLDLPGLKRRSRQRRLVLLIDVSGSMSQQTDFYMRFAHALMRATDQLEVFTLGTRLTRVTRAMKLRHRDQALATASALVADWDGGTRLGDALEKFLAVPRFAGLVRGAMVVVLSDGLERGDNSTLRDAVARLSRMAWSILWLSPLANEQNYQPQTEAMQAILPYLDRLGSGASVTHLCTEVLEFGRKAA